MKLFNKSPGALTPAPKLTIGDLPMQLFQIYERLYQRNRRLYGLAAVLGGEYPTADIPITEAPLDICGRLAYDMQNINSVLEDMDFNIHKLEVLLGLEVPSEPAAKPESSLSPPGFDGDSASDFGD